MSIELGSLATATKSAGVRVIPMESMRTPSAAVKCSVVKKWKVDGRLMAMAVNRTVQRGKSTVAAFAVLVYASKKLVERDLSTLVEPTWVLCVVDTRDGSVRYEMHSDDIRWNSFVVHRLTIRKVDLPRSNLQDGR